MNKPVTEEKPLLNIDRSPFVLLSAALLSLILCVASWWFLKQVSPYGFLFAVPAVVLTFQTAWLLLNPFALIYDHRLEIRQSWFHHKDRYFNDLNKVSQNKRGDVFITYSDGEVEKLGLFGIHPAHKQALVESCSRQISQTLVTRA